MTSFQWSTRAIFGRVMDSGECVLRQLSSLSMEVTRDEDDLGPSGGAEKGPRKKSITDKWEPFHGFV